MSETKKCKQCGNSFVVEDDDLDFYKRISPTFDGKTFAISSPTLCPDCRQQKRMVWRNEQFLYKRKCDLCSKNIISMYSPDKPLKIYCQDCWWSDKWDAKEYTVGYNGGSFFKQFKKLYNIVPKIGTSVTNSENCEFNSYVVDSKDCYMVISSRAENCMYGRKMIDTSDTIDALFAIKCESCYEVVFSSNSNNCFFIQFCNNCSDSKFLYACTSCHDCFMCSNLYNKSYYIQNQSYSKEEYKKKITELWNGSYKNLTKLKKKFAELVDNTVKRKDNIFVSDNCSGNDLIHCKNCKDCYELKYASDCKRMYDAMGIEINYSHDSDWSTGDYLYECVACFANYKSFFGLVNHRSRELIYSADCFNNSHNLFGCVGMKKSKYSILNKEYSEKEYEKKVGQIIEEMQKLGEWGEMFPNELSPFGYNETVANIYFPKTKDEALEEGFSWHNDELIKKFDGQVYEPKDDIKEYIEDESERQKLLAGILKCEVTGRPYKIVSQELAFYMQHGIPIPRKHYEVRFQERFNMRNPRKLYHRQCMCKEKDHNHEGKCKVEFETTYDPNRPEKVYCEKCYQQSII